MLNGLDISSYQKPTPPLTGLSFVFAKAGESWFTDSMYATHAANVRKAGLVLGAYWFFTNPGDYRDRDSVVHHVTVASQVTQFLNVVAGADLLALDYESPATDAAGAKAFIAAVKARGFKIGLYHSASGFPAFGQDWNWVAKWGATPPTTTYAFWQYSGTGLDRDKFNGDLAALNNLAGLTSGGIAGDAMALAPIKTHGDLLVNIPAGETLYDEDAKTAVGTTDATTSGPDRPCVCTAVLGGVTLYGQWVSISAGVFGLRFAAGTNPRIVSPAGFTQGDLDAAKVSGRQFEWDRQHTSATVNLAPRP